eukprot:374413-Hanusia_phi.AAC.1
MTSSIAAARGSPLGSRGLSDLLAEKVTQHLVVHPGVHVVRHTVLDEGFSLHQPLTQLTVLGSLYLPSAGDSTGRRVGVDSCPNDGGVSYPTRLLVGEPSSASCKSVRKAEKHLGREAAMTCSC